MAGDAGVGKKAEPGKGGAEVFAFAQDGDPAQARPKDTENQLFSQGAGVAFGHAPFGIVVMDVERVSAATRAASANLQRIHRV